jgi:Domain of unknown function (DUF3463)
VSPGYAYERAPDQQHFLNREKTKTLFRQIFALGKGGKAWPFFQSKLFEPMNARLGAIRRARSSAGSGLVIFSVKAMRRASRS